MPAFNYYQFISPKGEDLVLTQKVNPYQVVLLIQKIEDFFEAM